MLNDNSVDSLVLQNNKPILLKCYRILKKSISI